VLEDGGVVRQETRHWEPAAKRTITMRVKETADDYRLFPEPDLAPYNLSDEFIEGIRARLPELPDAKALRYRDDFGLSAADARNLAGDVEVSDFFDAAMGGKGDKEMFLLSHHDETAETSPLLRQLPQSVANLLLNEVAASLNANNLKLSDTALTPLAIRELAELLLADSLSSRQAKEVLAQLMLRGGHPKDIVQELGLKQLSDTAALEAVVEEVLAANPQKVEEYRAGKTGLLGFFVGQAMKATQGQGNPKLLNELLTKGLQASGHSSGDEA
jgi:aspartyl-tRNA(Asn)/glutamyl-tRNA(Gln) amidotransferase subunit B